jgi:hypothetical protein
MGAPGIKSVASMFTLSYKAERQAPHRRPGGDKARSFRLSLRCGHPKPGSHATMKPSRSPKSRARGTMIANHGTQFVAAGEGRAVARLDFV